MENLFIYIIGFIISYLLFKVIEIIGGKPIPNEDGFDSEWDYIITKFLYSLLSWIMVVILIIGLSIYFIYYILNKLPKDPPKWL